MTESNYDYHEGSAVPIKAWVRGVPMDYKALDQLKNVASLPFIYKHVAVMPDVHFGRGATIGSVIPTKGAIIPAAVGVDIGCGMMAVRTSLSADQLPDNLAMVRSNIEALVPVGRASHSIENLPKMAENTWYSKFKRNYEDIQRKYSLVSTRNSPALQIGTLGGGNHFIEICLDENQDVWIMLHSGSRGIGNRIGTFFINKAKEEMERLFIHLPDRDLAYLAEGSDLFDDYIDAVSWAQDYALANREVIMQSVLNAMRLTLPRFRLVDSAVNCHHNYVSKENHFGANIWLTRKGAVRARYGDLGIIPGSMGAKSFIVRGKGNVDSFHSCSHGAGRVMSRTEAKRVFSVEDHEQATHGVECRKDEGVLDETPGAYKNIDDVMAAQSDLVDIVHILRQVVCVKG